LKVNPKVTLALSVFAGAAAGNLANDPATAFLSVVSAEHAIVGAALFGFAALAHYLQDAEQPAPQTVIVQHVAAHAPAVAPVTPAVSS
jgi:hypothetical protein